MATHIVSAEISTTEVTLDLSGSFSTIGEILNNIVNDIDNTGNSDFNSTFITAAQETGASDDKLRLTSLGKTGSKTGWRIRNGFDVDQNAALGEYRGETLNYNFLSGYDTFILSPHTGTHLLNNQPKAVGSQDFITATPQVFATDGYDIIGSNFDDIIEGSASTGRDTLTGRLGSDLLVGNNGEDYFSYSPSDITDAATRTDQIQNFTVGTDKIELTGGLSLGSDLFNPENGKIYFSSSFFSTNIAQYDGSTFQTFALVNGVILGTSDFIETV